MGHGEREIGDDRCTIERDVMRERCRSINGGGGREIDADMLMGRERYKSICILNWDTKMRGERGNGWT